MIKIPPEPANAPYTKLIVSNSPDGSDVVVVVEGTGVGLVFVIPVTVGPPVVGSDGPVGNVTVVFAVVVVVVASMIGSESQK